MELNEIQENLQQQDFQYRLKAIRALHQHPTDIAVPLILDHLTDREFLVRTFVAMALGKHQTDRTFQALLELMKYDDTPSVRAEASNSLSLFGRDSISHLTTAFLQDDSWILRRSILAAITDLDSPIELLEICLEGLKGTDRPLHQACIASLLTLTESPQKNTVMEHLIELANDEDPEKRILTAQALQHFDHPRATATLQKLRQDPDHRVIAAALEKLL